MKSTFKTLALAALCVAPFAHGMDHVRGAWNFIKAGASKGYEVAADYVKATPATAEKVVAWIGDHKKTVIGTGIAVGAAAAYGTYKHFAGASEKAAQENAAANQALLDQLAQDGIDDDQLVQLAQTLVEEQNAKKSTSLVTSIKSLVSTCADKAKNAGYWFIEHKGAVVGAVAVTGTAAGVYYAGPEMRRQVLDSVKEKGLAFGSYIIEFGKKAGGFIASHTPDSVKALTSAAAQSVVDAGKNVAALVVAHPRIATGVAAATVVPAAVVAKVMVNRHTKNAQIAQDEAYAKALEIDEQEHQIADDAAYALQLQAQEEAGAPVQPVRQQVKRQAVRANTQDAQIAQDEALAIAMYASEVEEAEAAAKIAQAFADEDLALQVEAQEQDTVEPQPVFRNVVKAPAACSSCSNGTCSVKRAPAKRVVKKQAAHRSGCANGMCPFRRK